MTPSRVISISVCTLLLLGATGACKQETSEHPAHERAEAFLDALKYGDASRAASLHVESTEEGFYCASNRFTEVLGEARMRRSSEECARVTSLTSKQVNELSAQGQLLAQIVRFTCEYPDAGCADYGERVLSSHLAERLDVPGYRWAVDSWSIERMMGDDSQAVVYVDLVERGGDKEASHETLAMKKVDGQWYVSTPLDDQQEHLAR